MNKHKFEPDRQPEREEVRRAEMRRAAYWRLERREPDTDAIRWHELRKLL